MRQNAALAQKPTALPVPGPVAGRARVSESNSVADGMTAHLLAVAEQRDRRAFAALFSWYAPRLKGWLIGQGCEASQAEDVAQETMVAVWRKAHLFDPQKAEASTWIFTIARNLRIDLIRRSRRPEPDPHDPAFVPDPPAHADEQMGAEQRAARVRHAIASLPADQAEVVRLSFYHDHAHGEIATRLGLPLGTVKSRLRLAFNKVRAALGELEP